MSAKQRVLQTVRALPDDYTLANWHGARRDPQALH
jgi:hypothetical protein